MAAKLTDAQAQQALATVLEQIDKTTNPDALRALAGALQAVAAKLTDAQAQQALATVLEQIGKTTDPDALRALAGALQAVAAKLTDAQAQQALATLLEQDRQDNQSLRAPGAGRGASGGGGKADRRTGAAGVRYGARTN